MQSRLTPFFKKAVVHPRPHLDLNFNLRRCSFGKYPWDDWERWAVASGLEAGLAGQCRLLLREAYNHGWESWLQNLCGWADDGQGLLGFALRSPVPARWCIMRLLETDGLRGDYHPQTGDWTWGYLRIDTRRVISTLDNGTLNPGEDHALAHS